ncbi:Protein RRNAD1 like protein [Argiope bruennichi]|uniref:Protein RRNAD1 like protein n=1 Tax=Argiope bruennichi TaxID=94029 RepID=A0A8T0FGA3_ARGBR|nr:Protein RRNAD1 like protein [Argiope bruennichi]
MIQLNQDYFVEKLWTHLPSGWLETVMEFDIDDLELFINSEENVRCRRPWPLTLLSFRASAFALTLSRKSIYSPEVIRKFLEENFKSQSENCQIDSASEECCWSFSSSEFESKSGQHKKIPEFCRRHVKPKKQHEIFRMAQVTDSVMKYFDLKHAIDIGSGQGHLSRLLALCYNLKLATLEANQLHVSGAVQFDKQAINSLRRVKKYKSDVSTNVKTLPHHVESSVTLSSSESCLEKVLKHAWDHSLEDYEKFALMGLHTCGNLAETVLKTFAKCDQSQVLLSIGCCYMKLESTKDSEGYPLSLFVKSLPSHSLSYEAKEMACHALEMYIQRLHDKVPHLKIHCYRATLEQCIVHHHPELKHLGLRGVKNAESLPFQEYAQRALSKASVTVPNEFYSLPEIQACLERWKEVLIFYSLRLITAPVVESLILLDRLIYLYEQGYPGCIVPIFDPTLSPRNQILISAKFFPTRSQDGLFFTKEWEARMLIPLPPEIVAYVVLFHYIRMATIVSDSSKLQDIDRSEREGRDSELLAKKKRRLREKETDVFIGGSVGKTSITARIDAAALSSQRCPSGTTFVSCNVLFREKSLNLEILDISGEEKLRCMAPIYYREAKAALCVFDLTSEKTFHSLQRWIDSIKNNARDDCQLIILGNKVDLEDIRQVTKERAEKYSIFVGATYFEVSAVTGVGLLNVVISISKQILCLSDCSISYAAKRSIISNSIEYISPKKEEKKRRFSFPIRRRSLMHEKQNIS